MSSRNDRRNLEQELATTRLAAYFGFSLISLTIFVGGFLFGFNSAEQQLFYMGVGHFLLGPLSVFAAVRLGIAIRLSLVLAIVVLSLDIVQFVIRITCYNDSLLDIFRIVWIGGFVLLDLIIVGFLVRVDTTDRAQNNKRTDQDRQLLRQSLIVQTSNTIQLAAIFSFVVTSLYLFFWLALSLIGVSLSAVHWVRLGHYVVAAAAILIFDQTVIGSTLYLIAGLIQSGLDIVVFIVLITQLNNETISVLTTANIFSVALLLIGVAFLLISFIHVISAIDYLTLGVSTEEGRKTMETRGKIMSRGLHRVKSVWNLTSGTTNKVE